MHCWGTDGLDAAIKLLSVMWWWWDFPHLVCVHSHSSCVGVFALPLAKEHEEWSGGIKDGMRASERTDSFPELSLLNTNKAAGQWQYQNKSPQLHYRARESTRRFLTMPLFGCQCSSPQSRKGVGCLQMAGIVGGSSAVLGRRERHDC